MRAAGPRIVAVAIVEAGSRVGREARGERVLVVAGLLLTAAVARRLPRSQLAGRRAKLRCTNGTFGSFRGGLVREVKVMADNKKTLDDSDIISNHPDEKEVSRRSMLGALGSVVATGAAATVMSGCYRRAVVVGPRAPNAVVVGAPPPVVVQGGGQRWCSGVTDSDGGPYADPGGCGRGQRAVQCSGITDSDGGPGADPGGCGRGRYGVSSGVTDSDGGPYADPAGNGRGGSRGYSGITDSDGGPYADAAGHGRGRWR